MNQNNYIQEDEIDLAQLAKTLWSHKNFIILFTVTITLLAIVFVVFFKNPKPIYLGTLLVEIGQYKTADGFKEIDNPNNLKYILEAESNDKLEKLENQDKQIGLTIDIPRGTNKLILLNAKYESYKEIKDKIENIYTKLLENQQEKLKMYKDYIPTKKIGQITIDEEPINKPKKKLIVTVSFVTGFILSIFLVFFMEFISGIKNKEKNEL